MSGSVTRDETATFDRPIRRLQVQLLTDDSKLVVLESLKGLFDSIVRDDARGVDHARAKEPRVEVVTAYHRIVRDKSSM